MAAALYIRTLFSTFISLIGVLPRLKPGLQFFTTDQDVRGGMVNSPFRLRQSSTLSSFSSTFSL